MSTQDDLQTAGSCLRSGTRKDSQNLSVEILKKRPAGFEALLLAGLSFMENKQYDLAKGCFEKFLDNNPDDARGYFYLGNMYYALGNLNEAEGNYQQAVIRAEKDSRIYNNLGIVLREKGEFDKAVTCLQKAVKIDPGNQRAYYNLGNVMSDLGRTEGALRCFKKALDLDPSEAVYYKALGNALKDQGKFNEGIDVFSRALSLFPDDPEVFFGMGAVLKDLGRLDEAVDCYQKALKRNPNQAKTYYNLGNVFLQQNRLEEAKAQFDQALRLNPLFAEAYNNLGTTHKEANEIYESLRMFEKALEIKTDFPEARWNLGLTHLVSGNFREGWEGYEWRWEKPDYKQYKRSFSQPQWKGEDLFGQTMLLHAEQGFGDALQFVRYVPLVAVSGARVIVECSQELKALLSGLEGAVAIKGRGESLPDFDFHCPLMTLPRILGTNLNSIPRNIPYLKVSPELVQSWKVRVPNEKGKIKVGLVWAGNPDHLNDRNRSCALETLAPLFVLEGVQFLSLQIKGGSKEAAENPLHRILIDLTDGIRDFSDTAALIENLDLVISVDTAVAHLAGALGKKVWTILPYSPDWRWLLDREDSPWYPTMRLYRQPKPGDWEAVSRAIQRDLALLAIDNTAV
ncbi:MAG: tetratricopeptide repeat protein [Thermodesulfobacteriota bacterium]